MSPNPSPAAPDPERRPEPREPLTALIECGVAAYVQALIATIWGQIILGLLGGLLEGFMPSAPPGWRVSTPVALKQTGSWFSTQDHQIWILFWVFFVCQAGGWFFQARGIKADGRRATFFKEISRRVAEGWFKLLFENAIGAMITAWVLAFTQQFSWTALLWRLLVDPILHVLMGLVRGLLGHGAQGSLQGWLDWYGDNQIKFNFWLIYTAAICDDLGLPNLKTLARWVWRRWRERLFPDGNKAPAQGSVDGATGRK